MSFGARALGRLRRRAWPVAGACLAATAVAAAGAAAARAGAPGVVVLAGFAGSLVLGSALASAVPSSLRVRRRRRGLRGAREAEAALGLPVLGVVPRVGGGRDRADPLRLVRDAPGSPYAAAVRDVLEAAGAAAGGGTRVLLVTSSLPGEGKTTLALSLAALAARTGRAAVLDLDLRQPVVHRRLGHGAGVGAGLVEHLAGGRPLGEVLRHDPETGLDFVPAGGPTDDPTALIEGEPMARLVAFCRAGYDLVVIDAAPAGVITDAGVAARLADRVLFAVQWGETPASVAREGLRALRGAAGSAAGARAGGVVLTQASAQAAAQASAAPSRGGRR